MLMAAVIVARASGDEKIPTVDATPPDTIKHSELHALGEKIRQTIKETVRMPLKAYDGKILVQDRFRNSIR